ncbi:MAG TPA: hypothetical protein VFQ67_18045 [Allosphingosinicella sp.]|nr:hypothetical protein [Allosphingosinicella sp.]
MTRGSARRRLRLRRKRKGETFGSRLADNVDLVEVGNVAGDLDVDIGAATEVVGHMGCCVVEAVGSMAVLLALLTVPAYLLTR